MSTRSVITFTEKFKTRDGSDKRNLLCTIYQHEDGYIEGVGYDLANWLLKKKLCNGISMDPTLGEYANGVGCLVAQFIKNFKTEIGGLYISYTGDRECYNYDVVIDEMETGSLDDLTTITVTRYDNDEPIFVGKPSELLKFVGNE